MEVYAYTQNPLCPFDQPKSPASSGTAPTYVSDKGWLACAQNCTQESSCDSAAELQRALGSWGSRSIRPGWTKVRTAAGRANKAVARLLLSAVWAKQPPRETKERPRLARPVLADFFFRLLCERSRMAVQSSPRLKGQFWKGFFLAVHLSSLLCSGASKLYRNMIRYWIERSHCAVSRFCVAENGDRTISDHAREHALSAHTQTYGLLEIANCCV